MRLQLGILLPCLVLYCQIYRCDGEICAGPVCKYTFDVRRGQTMTFVDKTQSFIDDIVYNTFNVRLNSSRLQIRENLFRRGVNHDLIGEFVDARDVITADGFERDIITINDQFPGPNIEVMEGSQVEVNVINHLWTETMTVHWHGLSQRDNVWMDGVPHLTQCPIQPKQSFIYRFIAEPAGTHWYHSHIANQRLDGLFGMFIVHKTLPKIPNIPVTLMDWYHEPATQMHVLNPYDLYRPGSGDMHRFPVDYRHYSHDSVELSALGWQSGLINGRGRSGGLPYPLTNFTLTPGGGHRFRVAHTGAEFTLELAIDNHKLQVVASDGHEISPVKVDYLLIFPGETYDVEVRANQRPGKYWFRASTVREGDGPDPRADGANTGALATVTYKGRESDVDPKSKPRKCTRDYPCVVFNCPFADYGVKHNRSCVALDAAESRDKSDTYRAEFGLDDDEIHEFFFNMAFSAGSSVNGRKFVGPSEPFYQNKSRSITPCNYEECRQGGCACTTIHKFPYNKTVQVVFTGIQPDFDFVAHHSIHVHGHNFAVLKVGYPVHNATTGRWIRQSDDIWCESSMCNSPRWRTRPPAVNVLDPPVKDTVLLPARGYVVVRFRTDNPGYWRVHCHQELHLMEGMDMILDEGPGFHPPLPPDFPTCLPFQWTQESFKKYRRHVADNLKQKTTNVRTPPQSDYISSFDIEEKSITIRIDTKLAIIFTTLVMVGFAACLLSLIQYICTRKCRVNSNRQQLRYHQITTSDDEYIEEADDYGFPAKYSQGGANGVQDFNRNFTSLRKRFCVKEKRARNKTM